MSKHRYKRDYLTLVVLALFAVGALGMLIVVGQLKSVAEQSQEDTRCLLRELGAHRGNTYEANQVLLENHDINFHGPPPATLPATREWVTACDHILGEAP